MKKKIAGFALIALAAGALSAQVTVSGSLDGIQTMGLGSSSDAGATDKVNTHYLDARLTFTAKPSDFTTVVATMRARNYKDPTNAYIPLVLNSGPKEQVIDPKANSAFDWEYLYAKVDVIGGLGLTIPAKANFIFGKIEYTSKNYLTTTSFGVESVMNSIRSGDVINMGLEVAMKDLPLTLVGLTKTTLDEAIDELDDSDVATTDYVPSLYLAARLDNYKTSLGNLSAEVAYAMNSRKTNSGNSYGASAKLSIPVSDAITVPVGFGASYTEKNLDVLVDDVKLGFRDSTRIGAATGVSYKMSDDTLVALNIGGAYNVIKNKAYDTVNVMQLGIDGKATYKNYFGGLGVVMGSLGDVDVDALSYTLANSLGYEAYAGITPGKGCTLTLGYAAYSGLSARYAIAGKLPDASYKYVDSDGIAKTNVLYVKTSIKF